MALRKAPCLFIALSLLAPAGIPLQLHGGCTDLDDPFQVLDFHLELDPADWEEIKIHHSRDEEEEFVEKPAKFRCGDEEEVPVKVRQKQGIGGPVRDNPEKFPLKIDFDDEVKDGEWHGRRKIVLENGGSDVLRTLFREGLGWQLMSRAGMISGGSSWVRLHVNGQLIGLFIRVEQYDKSFLRRYLGEDDGFLYRFDYKEPDRIQQLTREGEDDPYAAFLCFAPFGSGCDAPATDLAELLVRDVDLEQLMTLAAMGGILANWDAPFMNDNNYFWYNSAPRRRLYFPWDLDLIISEEHILRDVHKDPGLKDSIWQTLLMNDPALRARFDESISRLLSDAMSPAALGSFLDRLEAVLAPDFDGDKNSGLGISFSEEVRLVSDWLFRRTEIVRNQVAAAPDFPVVINEVLAANLSGAPDDAGELEDWIELFNRSETPVPLAGLFLSDDPAEPDKWPLPDLILPAKERLLLWCDGETGQGPLHVGFGLDSSGETVGLYEVTAGDYRVRDFVRFGPQAPDAAIGRLPDGAAGFVRLRCPTPSAENSLTCEDPAPRFIRGDALPDGAVSLTDAVAILGSLFGGEPFACQAASDVDQSGTVSLTDAVALLLHLFQGAPPPPPPYPECGAESAASGFDCAETNCPRA